MSVVLAVLGLLLIFLGAKVADWNRIVRINYILLDGLTIGAVGALILGLGLWWSVPA
jgi:hypothetical protein